MLAGAVAPRGATGVTMPGTIAWNRVDGGVARASFEVQADPHLWHTRVVAVRLDADRFRFRLRGRIVDDAPAWSVARAPA